MVLLMIRHPVAGAAGEVSSEDVSVGVVGSVGSVGVVDSTYESDRITRPVPPALTAAEPDVVLDAGFNT